MAESGDDLIGGALEFEVIVAVLHAGPGDRADGDDHEQRQQQLDHGEAGPGASGQWAVDGPLTPALSRGERE